MLKDTTDKEETGSINFDEFKRIYIKDERQLIKKAWDRRGHL